MRALWQTLTGHRDLRLILIAGLISQTGDWILRVGLAYQIYVLTGSTIASATMLLASFLPQVVLGSIAGVFVDRWDRRRTMIGSNLLLALGLLPLILVTDGRTAWLVFLVLLWEGCVQQFFLPAEQSLVPGLVPDQQLITANALIGQTRDVARLLGSAIGGVVVAVGGMTLLTLVDIGSFLLAATMIMAIRTRRPRTGRVEGPGSLRLRDRVINLRTEWVSGLRLAAHERVLRLIMIFLLVTTVGEGVMGTLFAPFVRDDLGGTSSQYGMILSVQAIGGIVGGLVAAGLGSRFRPETLLAWGAIAFGAIDLAMFLYPLWFRSVWPAVLFMIIVGLPGALVLAGATTLLQRHAADDHRGRVFGAIGAVEGISIMVGAAAAGYLGERVAIIPVLAAQGVGYLLAGAVMVWALRRSRTGATSPA